MLLLLWLTTFAEGQIVDSLAVMLDEVSVSALKQMSHLRREPEAATIVTQSELERLDAVSIKGISDVVPNFFMPDYGSRITSTIYVRGIGARMDQPSVGLNVDNVPYLNKDAYDFDVADIASVEMLRGPQSTLYGRNTMAGVINVTTLSPMRFQGWRIMLQGSSRIRTKASAGWYHKFSPDLGFSATGSFSGARGEFTNEYNGRKLDWEQNYALRTKLQWRVAPGWNVVNTASAGFLRQGGYPYEYKETGKISFNDTCFYRRFTFADGFTARYSGDKFNVTSITSVQHINDNMTLDQDFLPEDYFTLSQKKREIALTEDIVARSVASGGKYNWLAGLFAFYKHLDMEAPVTFKDAGIENLIENHRNDANPYYPISWHSRTFPLNSDFTIPTWGVAAYHESVFDLGSWHFTAGLRLDYEKSTLNYRSYCSTGYTISQVEAGVVSFYRDAFIDIDDFGTLHRDFITLLPKVAVTYDFGDGMGNIYAKVSKGYKAGGFNTQMFSDVLQQRLMSIMGVGIQYNIGDIVGYKPEQSWNYEIGSHLDLLDGALGMDMAAFYIDCRDQQMTMFPDGTTTGRIMMNAGKTRSFGGEVSVVYKLNGQFSFNGSYGLTDARFRSFFDGISDFKGKKLPYAPRNTVFLQALWNRRVTEKVALSADVNVKGAGKIYWNEENTEWQNFYCLLGASLSCQIDNLTLQLWGKNLTDTRYRTFYFLSMGNAFYQRGKGVEAGLTARIVF